MSLSLRMETTEKTGVFAVWGLTDTLGKDAVVVQETMAKSFDTARLHECFVVFKDVVSSATALTALYGALKALVRKSGDTTLFFDSDVRLTRDEEGRFTGIGCKVIFARAKKDG